MRLTYEIRADCKVLTVDLGWTPDQYERWLAHALPHLLLRPELLNE